MLVLNFLWDIKFNFNIIKSAHELCNLVSDSGCINIAIFSTGETLSVHPNKLGLFRKENRLTNGRVVYRHRDNYYHLYWINEYGGYWMVNNFEI